MAIHDEKHWRIGELALRWGVSEKTARRLFANEPEVMRLSHPSRRVGRLLKRRYMTMTVPDSVAARVHARLCK